jgi:23S rRNA (adenine2503-C2)-methyltransferase
MPINLKYPISELLEACGKYFTKTGRRISYEYVIMDGLNDSIWHARQLKALLKGGSAHINIIPYNPVPGKPFSAPKAETVKKFHQELGGIATIRRTLGPDINAACGQLRSTKC